MVGATNRSMAAMSGAWIRRKVRHPGEGRPLRLTIYFATLDKAELEQLAVDARFRRTSPITGSFTLLSTRIATWPSCPRG